MSDREPRIREPRLSRSSEAAAKGLIEQAIAEVEALRLRLWSELEEDDPSLYDGQALAFVYRSLDRAVEDLRFALTGQFSPRPDPEPVLRRSRDADCDPEPPLPFGTGENEA